MQRLIAVYNPNSSQYVRVRDEVLNPLLRLKGVVVGKFAIKKAPFEQNVKELKSVLGDEDIVVVAGGDATAAVTANAILESGKNALLYVLPYGNFNDLARTLETMDAEEVLSDLEDCRLGSKNETGCLEVRKLYPLDVMVDGKHWRYATCYVTIGMTAEATELFDNPKVRKGMKKGHRSSWRSYLQLAMWYFKNRHKKVFIPEFLLNGKAIEAGVSDYMAVNGQSMSRVMKGGEDFLRPEVFRSMTEKTVSFRRLATMMMKSMLVQVPGEETSGDVLEFTEPARVEVQAEGEYRMFEGVRQIEVKKLGKFIEVACKKSSGM